MTSESAADGSKTGRLAVEDEPVFRSRKMKNGLGGYLEASQVNRIQQYSGDVRQGLEGRTVFVPVTEDRRGAR
jgi:hypothetical protein